MELSNINNSMNKYEKWYNSITSNAKHRVTESYTESHHIIPKSLNGTDEDFNLVNLTAREHFICHWLLTKIHTGQEKHKMLNALRMLRAEKHGQSRYSTKITSRVYANLKEEYAQLQSVKFTGNGNPMYGNKFHRSEAGRKFQKEAVTGEKNGSKQPLSRKKISESKLGKKRAPFSDEWRAKMSANNTGENNPMFSKEQSEDTRKKIGDKLRGRKCDPAVVAARAAKNVGKVREKKLCPHCNQEIAVNTYVRWHGENCKQKGTTNV